MPETRPPPGRVVQHCTPDKQGEGQATASATPGYDELATQIKAGNAAAVAGLLKAGVSPSSGGTANASAPLLLTATRRQHAIAALLLGHGADPNRRYAAYLLQRGANATLVGHGNALDVAMRRGDQPVVERLSNYLGRRRTVDAAMP